MTHGIQSQLESPPYETHTSTENLRSPLCDRLRRLRSKSYRRTETSRHHFESGDSHHHRYHSLQPSYYYQHQLDLHLGHA